MPKRMPMRMLRDCLSELLASLHRPAALIFSQDEPQALPDAGTPGLSAAGLCLRLRQPIGKVAWRVSW